MTKTTAVFASFAALVVAATASAHPHVHILPESANAGAPLSIAHYGDANLALVEGGEGQELHYDGSIYTVTADTQMTAGEYAGQYRGAIINFAADNAPDLANTPGPVGYEIVAFERTDGTPTDAVLTWRFFGHNANPAAGAHTLRFASSNADTASGRSFLHNPGDHVHATSGNPDSGFFLFVDQLGLYDITARAWDTSGFFTASNTVTFRVNVVPEPATLGLVSAAVAMVAMRRRR